MPKINYHSMKNDELKKIAEDLGIEGIEDLSRGDLITAITEANGHVTKKELNSTVDIVIHSKGGKDGHDAVFVAVNGKAWQIPREQRVTIPRYVFLVLENAVETHYDVKDDGEWEERDIPRFSYTVYEKD